MRNRPILSATALGIVLTVGPVPALARRRNRRVAMMDCILGDARIGTPGNGTIIGSQGQDTIYALEGDDIIDPGNGLMADYVSCGSGYDVVSRRAR